jgi:undecaprenyl-phosphate 4-deoxy-4-formamido-L-arabinose transferase
MADKIHVSVVIPVYNEEANLPTLLGRLVPVMEGLGKSFEIILIDDGSSDSSLALLT